MCFFFLHEKTYYIPIFWINLGRLMFNTEIYSSTSFIRWPNYCNFCISTGFNTPAFDKPEHNPLTLLAIPVKILRGRFDNIWHQAILYEKQRIVGGAKQGWACGSLPVRDWQCTSLTSKTATSQSPACLRLTPEVGELNCFCISPTRCPIKRVLMTISQSILLYQPRTIIVIEKGLNV